MKFNPSSQVFISQTKKALEDLKPKIYSKEILSLDQKEADYEAQKLQTDEYLKHLASYIQKFDIPTQDYKNIFILTQAQEKEKTIDQQRIMQDTQNLLLDLQAELSKNNLRTEIDSLMVKAQLFKDQKISPFPFYSYLKDSALKHNVIASPDEVGAKQSQYPHLMEFIDYLTKVNSLDSTKLFTEMDYD